MCSSFLNVTVKTTLKSINIWRSYRHRHPPKIWGALPPFVGGVLGPHLTMSLGLKPTSLPSGILIHPAIWPQETWAKNWGTVPLWGGELGSHLAQCGLGRDLPPCQVASWAIQPSGHKRHGQKNMGRKFGGGSVPFWGKGSWVAI